MQHLHAHAFDEGEAPGHHHHHEDHRSLYLLTLVMGVLIGGDVVFGWLGWERWRSPAGISLAMIAAGLGGVWIVGGAIEALEQRRDGGGIAPGQAWPAPPGIRQAVL